MRRGYLVFRQHCDIMRGRLADSLLPQGHDSGFGAKRPQNEGSSGRRIRSIRASEIHFMLQQVVLSLRSFYLFKKWQAFISPEIHVVSSKSKACGIDCAELMS